MSVVKGRRTVNHIDMIDVDVYPNEGTGASAPVGSLCLVEQDKSWWLKTGAGDLSWELQFNPLINATQKITYYPNGYPQYIDFYKDITLTNRVARSSLTFSLAGDLTTEVTQFFLSDGVTVFKTVTSSFFYTGSNFERVESVVS